MPTANQELFDATVRHQIALLRYSTGQAKRVAQLLQDSDDELAKLLRNGDLTAATEARLKAVLADVRRLRDNVFAHIGDKLKQDLEPLAETEASWELDAIKQVSPVELSLTAPSPATLKAVAGKPINGVPLDSWLGNLKGGDISRIEQQVRLGVIQGDTVDQLVRRVRGSKANNFEDGVAIVTRRHAQTIARTAVNHVSNSARHEVWHANADIIDGVRWTSTLDGRTSEICRSRDGTVYPIDKGPRPPAHPGCRSTTVAVLKGEAIVGERPMVRDTRTRAVREKDFRAEAQDAAGDKWKGMSAGERNDAVKAVRQKWIADHVGTVASTTNYDTWLRSQPKEFQNEVLGVGKAEMFRKGLTLDKFVDEKGHAYTLSELQAHVHGDKLNVVAPQLGMKAKALLQTGMSTDEVLASLKKEFPDAATTPASIASYKSELKKAGLLDQLQGVKVEQAGGVMYHIDHFEKSLPEGVKHALAGQWANVVDELDGVPGAYSYYQAGKGVSVSKSKLASVPAAQVQQILAHEFGHLLHKQHEVNAFTPGDLANYKNFLLNGSPDNKKLYAYYLSHPDELVAEIYSQALSPSPLTSQGLPALEFNKILANPILDAKKAIQAKFPLPGANAKAPLPGAPTSPFEVAGKHPSASSLAKAMLQQNVPAHNISEAIKAQFPEVKDPYATIASAKSSLKKAGLLDGVGQSGPTVAAKVTPATAPPPMPKPTVVATSPHVAAQVLGPVDNKVYSGSELKQFGIELFEQGIVSNQQVAELLKLQRPASAHLVKVENVASWKTNWKKQYPERFTAAEKKAAEGEKLAKAWIQEKKAKGSGSAPQPQALPEPKLAGKSLGPHSSAALAKLKSAIQAGADGDALKETLVKHFGSYDPVGGADLIELAKYEVLSGKAVAKPYLAGAYTAPSSTPPAPKVAEATTWSVPSTPVLDTSLLKPGPKMVLGTMKNGLKAGKSSYDVLAHAKGSWGSTTYEYEKLLQQAKYEIASSPTDLAATIKAQLAGGPATPKKTSPVDKAKPYVPPPSVDFTPATPATTPREGMPPPPRFTEEQRAAAIRKWAGSFDTSQHAKMNKAQTTAGLPALTEAESAAIRHYTGGTYSKLNRALRGGEYADRHDLQAYSEAAQSGLAKMPKYVGRTSRGLTLSGADLQKALDTYKPGAVVEENAFISTSHGEQAAFSGNMYMKIKSKNGVQVQSYSYYPGEREVLYMPGTRLKVVSIVKDGSKYVVEMEEI